MKFMTSNNGTISKPLNFTMALSLKVNRQVKNIFSIGGDNG